MKTFFGEFKQFIARGNVMDMAVGVIIGGAFNGIITSLIDCIINPILGMFAGDGTALAASLSFRLPGVVYSTASSLPGGGELLLGSFLTSVLNFLVMAFVVFCLLKGLNKLHRKKEEASPPPPGPSNEEILLTEIRDLLKEKGNG